MASRTNSTAERVTPNRRLFTYNHKVIEPNPRHAKMSVDELCEAVIAQANAQHTLYLTACLASHMDGNDELHAWADDLVDESSVEIDRLLIELESRNDLNAQEAEQRNYAVKRGWHLSHIIGQLGLTVTVKRDSAPAKAPPGAPGNAAAVADALGNLEDDVYRLRQAATIAAGLLDPIHLERDGHARISRSELETITFAVNDAQERAERLDKAFHLALTGRKIA